ncbi:bactofilin family protein [Alkalilacustris brevis]|uniref:bactofilin family protein n=1 Tax=Alkalilacustris brevis TaxID=2026338 RepID=UPI000E0CD3A8|nr:polymer-forming cytoskeletal protein [Alkalilacustris brevis]
MFSKSRINDPGPKKVQDEEPSARAATEAAPSRAPGDAPSTPKVKPPASTLSADLSITGNLRTTGDIVVEGNVDGDIRAHLLTVGEGATVRGEIVADDVVINGRIIGRVRGLKVRLSSSARVEGDIIHKTIAIESGAHFEGSVQRQEDPLAGNGNQQNRNAAASNGAQQPRPAAGSAPQQGGAKPAAPQQPQAAAAKPGEKG